MLKDVSQRHAAPGAESVFQVVEAGNPTEKQRRIRDGILRGTVDAPR
jgi:hypothetical protein